MPRGRRGETGKYMVFSIQAAGKPLQVRGLRSAPGQNRDRAKPRSCGCPAISLQTCLPYVPHTIKIWYHTKDGAVPSFPYARRSCLDITLEAIDSYAPNAAASQNGLELFRKGRLKNLRMSRDGALLLGGCEGSGKEDYAVSADFIDPANPVFRCTCPSRQYPCKHALGLLWARAGGGKFMPCDIPDDILEKREKAAKRRQSKEDAPGRKPAERKANRAALAKKIQAQTEGLGILDKVAREIASAGLGLMNRERANAYRPQVLQLGDHYLPGAQAMLRGFLLLFEPDRMDEGGCVKALAELGRLHALAARGREYLEKKAEDPEANLDTATEMEELLGNAWQLSQLKALGMAETDAELMQLSFRCYADEAAQEFVDEGLWVNLKSGETVRTVSRRPYKAVKHIKEEDSFSRLARVPELVRYPGEMNPRVRWEGMTAGEPAPEHFERILAHAVPSYADAVKAARKAFKNPLYRGSPAFLLRFSRIGTVGDEAILENEAGERLALADAPDYPHTVGNLYFLGRKHLENAAMFGVFHRVPGNGKLCFHPLSVVWPGGIVRLG
jgi:hypothetical protein